MVILSKEYEPLHWPQVMISLMRFSPLDVNHVCVLLTILCMYHTLLLLHPMCCPMRFLRTSEEPSFWRVWTSLIHCQTDSLQIEDIQQHCYPSLEWSSNKHDSKSKIYNALWDHNPRATSKHLQANVSIHESTIRQTMSENGSHGMTAWGNLLLSRKNIS